MNIKRVLPFAATIGAFLLIHHFCFSASGTSRIASPADVVRGPSITSVVTKSKDGKTITTLASPWPEGTLDIVNHPLRTNGWNSWFTEWPNDVDSFDLEIRYPRDVEQVLRTFAAIKTSSLRLELRQTTAKRATWTGASKSVGAEFRIGNQAIVNHWFERLPADEKGVRIFGTHRYIQPPPACPPTLTLYVRHAAVDLNKLTVPLNIEVVALVGDADAADDGESAAVRAIQQFVAAHKAKQDAAKKSGADKK